MLLLKYTAGLKVPSKCQPFWPPPQSPPGNVMDTNQGSQVAQRGDLL